MKKYLLHLLKKNLIPLACLTLFCLLAYVLPIMTMDFDTWNNASDKLLSPPYNYTVELCYGYISAALGLMSILIPIYLFSYKMNRRSIDMHYSLPITKTKILVANFLVGLILLFASYSVAYWLGFAAIAIKVKRLHLIYYLLLYCASILPAFIIYAFTTFIYTRANTIVDGIISVIGAMCILPLAVGVIEGISHNFNIAMSGVDGGLFFPFGVLTQVTDKFGDAVIAGGIDTWFSSSSASVVNRDICALISAIVWALIAAGATAGLILSEKHCKAENCAQVSESIFCYKVQIPIYVSLLSIFIFSNTDSPIALACIIAFGAFVMSIIYKRTIKMGWKWPVVLAACIVGGILLYVIPWGIYNAIIQ